MGIENRREGKRAIKSFKEMGKALGHTGLPDVHQEEKVIENEDPFKDWTYAQRMDEYAETGDPSYLTPTLAARMGVALDRGDDDAWEHPEADREVGRTVLLRYGVDIDQLEHLNPQDAIQTLLPLINVRLRDHYDHESEDARNVAQMEGADLMLRTPKDYVPQFFDAIDLHTTQGISTMHFLDENVNLLMGQLEDMESGEIDHPRAHLHIPQIRSFLEACIPAAESLKHRALTDKTSIYLLAARAQSFANRILDTEPTKMDPDRFVPFEIERGVYASLTTDGARMYVSTPEISEHITNALRENWTREFIERGHDLPTYDYEFIGEDLLNLHYAVLDQGASLEDYIRTKKPILIAPEAVQEAADDLIVLLSSPVRKIVEQDLGFRLKELTLQEQIFFLNYAKQVTVEEFQTLKSFSEKFGLDGLRTFLVTAENSVLREKVFEFAQTAPEEDARSVFAAYSKLVGSIDDVGDYLREQFGQKDDSAASMVVERLLERAKHVLSDAYKQKDSPEKIAELVESIRQDAQLFLDSCRTLKSRGELSLEAIHGGELSRIDGGGFSQEEVERILAIQSERYQGKYSEKLFSELRDALETALDDPHTNFYVFRQNGQIVSIVRFDAGARGLYGTGKHMASFITNRKFEGGALGQALLETAIKNERTQAPIYAECDPSLVPFYEKFGFKIARGPYTDDYGEATCDIELPLSAPSSDLPETN